MPVELALSTVVPIFKGKGDVRNSICYRTVKLLEHGMKVVERVLEKRLCSIVSVDEKQFRFMPERVTIDAVLILRMLQEEHHAKGICICNSVSIILSLLKYKAKLHFINSHHCTKPFF